MKFKASWAAGLALVLGLCGCDHPSSPKEQSRWEAGVRYKDASAEMIRESLLPLELHLVLAIVRDGEAAVYFEGTREEIDAMLTGAKDRQPQALIIEHLHRREEPLPPIPPQVPSRRLSIELNREEVRRRGLSVSQAMDQITTIMAAAADGEDASKVFAGKFLQNASGEKVPLDEIAVAQNVEVLRPLILPERTAPPAGKADPHSDVDAGSAH